MSIIESNSDNYEAIRCMRHGYIYNLLWKQEIKDCTTTKCVNSMNLFEVLNSLADGALQHVSLYKKIEKMMIIGK